MKIHSCKQDHSQAFADARQWLLDFPETAEDFPFGPDVAVFKVKGKMYATLAIAIIGKKSKQAQSVKSPVIANDAGPVHECRMNLKCDPQEAIMLRDVFNAVMPGYHMNKQHWNTVKLDGSLPQGELKRMIDNSYMLVVNKLLKKDQVSILLHL
ncbi:MmcQ/YjbR family DNA-binding protein [Paraglaciecola sp. L1A13]|uniref:MmcQ/YjbR family DNA-binding protein n=1 Tax=Paraglaciecola sp. L1A13 TaxID=2686359 RepID=UPI00131B0BAE|nr:MmcQ/YjbR family DNA-binding protein [Paraglaciecola sp. L1A13]